MSSQSDQALRKALGYKRFTGVPRILVFDSTYYVVRDVIEAIAGEGYTLFTIPALGKGRGEEHFVHDLLLLLCAHRPDFVLTINHLGFDQEGILAQLLARYEIPLASWFVDHPLPILGGAPGNVTPTTQVFCIERSALPWLGDFGFVQPEYLPTAAGRAFHPTRIDRQLASSLGAPLCWVGDSWWRKAYEEPPPWAQIAAERLHKEARKLGSRSPFHGEGNELISKDVVRLHLPGLIARLRADPSYGGPSADGIFLVTLTALAQAASAERATLARALAPFGIRVHGDAHWRKLSDHLDVRPPIDPRTTAPVVYAGSAVNINQTAVHMPTALNQRVWDVPAAGGFLLTDNQEDLWLHFEPSEVAAYDSPQEASEKAVYYMNRPEERQRISRAAGAKVDQFHRYSHRIRQIVQVMRQRFGG